MSKVLDNREVLPKKVVKLRKNGSKFVVREHVGESLTDQSFKEDCDVNFIVRRFLKTGEITHLARSRGIYDESGEFADFDFMEASNVVARAVEAFEALPSRLRERFSNSPHKYIEFLSDSSNDDEAVRLGLKVRPAVPVESSPAPSPGADKAKPRQSLKSKSVQTSISDVPGVVEE